MTMKALPRSMAVAGLVVTNKACRFAWGAMITECLRTPHKTTHATHHSR